jgi:ATP synthase I chain
MSRIADSASATLFCRDNEMLESRVFRAMIAVVTATVLIALFAARWQVTTGLLLGGLLSLLNYHWLRTSMAAIFVGLTADVRPRIGIIRYILRYVIIAMVVLAAYKLRLISLPATIIGLASFVPAFFIEALRQSYFAISGREESF